MKNKILTILMIIISSIIILTIYYLSHKSQNGTIEYFLNIEKNDISHVSCTNNNMSVNELVGTYWYKIFERKLPDTFIIQINNICDAYDIQNNLIFEIIRFNDDSYLFDKKKININENINYIYVISK